MVPTSPNVSFNKPGGNSRLCDQEQRCKFQERVHELSSFRSNHHRQSHYNMQSLDMRLKVAPASVVDSLTTTSFPGDLLVHPPTGEQENDLAADLCNAAASLHETNRLEHALDLYNDSLQEMISAIQSGRRHRGAEDCDRVVDRMCDLESMEMHLRRRSKLNWARSIMLREGHGSAMTAALLSSSSTSKRTNASSSDAPLDLDLYSDSCRRPVSSFAGPLRIDCTRPEDFPRSIRSATLLHNMGLLHLHRTSHPGMSPDQQTDQLKSAEQLLHMAMTTVLDHNSAGGSSCVLSPSSSKKSNDPSTVLLLSILVAVGQVLTESGRHDEAVAPLSSALELAKQTMDCADSAKEDEGAMDAEEEDADSNVIASVKSDEDPALLCHEYPMSCCLAAKVSEAERSKAFSAQLQSFTISALVELARSHYRAGRYDTALRDAQDALMLRRATSPGGDADHNADVAVSIYNVGLIQEAAGDTDLAREDYAEFANHLLATGAADDSRCAHIVSALVKIIVIDCAATAVSEEGDSDCSNEEIAVAAQAIEDRRSALGWDHPSLIGPLTCVGRQLYDLGEYGISLPFFRECFRVQRRVLPAHHVDLAVTLNRIGKALHRMGDRAHASETYQAALRVRLKVDDHEERRGCSHADHPVYCSIMYNVGLILSETNRHEDAIQSLLLGKRMAEEVLNHLRSGQMPLRRSDQAAIVAEVATALLDIGSHLSSEYGRLSDSLQCLTTSLRLRRDLLAACGQDVQQQDGLSVAQCLSNIGRVLRDASRYAEAMENFTEALRIEMSILGPDHPDVASTISCVGQMYDLLGDSDEALRHFHRALRIVRSSGPRLGDVGEAISMPEGRGDMAHHYMSVSVLLSAIGTIHQQRGDERRASMAFSEAYALSGGAYGYEHDGRRTMADLDVVFKDLLPPAAAAA